MSNLPLPPVSLRQGGPRYSDDEVFLRSAVNNIRLLERECGINKDMRILDIGCGSARMLYGINQQYGEIKQYVGIDVAKKIIDWLTVNVVPIVPYASFLHVDYANARYNSSGKRVLDIELEGSFDCITLFSVFSHMRLEDIKIYCNFMRSVMSETGKIFLTAFVEDGVEDQAENPEGYHRDWSGPLHCVRLNRQVFENILTQAGLQVSLFRYRHTNDGQSSYVLSRSDLPFQARIVT